MRCSGVFPELLRIRRIGAVSDPYLGSFYRITRLRRIGGVSPPLLRKFLPHLIFQIRRIPAFDFSNTENSRI